MNLDEFNQKLEEYGKPKSGGYPSQLRCTASETEAGITLAVELLNPKEAFSGADVWGIAMLEEMKRSLPLEALSGKKFTLRFIADPNEKSDCLPQYYEELKRRLSYLAAVNKDVDFLLEKGPGQEDALYTMDQMIRLAQNGETVQHDEIGSHEEENKPGRLEKDFQTYLYGEKDPQKGWYTNKRLVLLGEDFSSDEKKEARLEREFPTGSFKGESNNANRILPTRHVDFITQNKHGDLAVIELKVPDSPKLEDIAQITDYALYFCVYKQELAAILEENYGFKGVEDHGIVSYLASNAFHKRFDDIWPYYVGNRDANNREWIHLKQVVMGYYKPAKAALQALP